MVSCTPMSDRAALPPTEPTRRLLLTRGIAVLALLATLTYLGWRAFFTLNLDGWYLSVPMLVLEIHAAVGLGLFTFSLWDVDRRPALHDPDRNLSVAVLIPTYNEGPEILLPTIAAAIALEPAHQTWVLDDGNRAEVAELAAALGARYLARPTHEHAKAGNLNYALARLEADVVAVLDADHVARPGFLLRTLGYFRDPRVAVVQTPQDFYNVTSFEHGTGSPLGEPFHEQTLFYRLLQPGKNRWNGAFWCGTNAVVRTSALAEIGGAATETITEDIHTTIRLHRRGWKTVYHNEVLAKGLAASDAAQYQLQRNRWGTGAMQVLRVENPLAVSGLSLGQRLAYAATLLGWFDAWRTLGLLLLPPLVLLTGEVPILADGATFVAAFAVTYGLQQLAMYRLGRGAYRPILSTVFELVRMTPNMVATLNLVVPRAPRFSVTPKGRTATNRGRTPAPRPLLAVMGFSVVAGATYVLTLIGLVHIDYRYDWAAVGAFAWLVVNFGLVVIAVRRVRSLRFAAERRSAVRFAVDTPGWVDAAPVTIQDLSVGGALLAAREPLIEREAHVLTFELPTGVASLWANVRSTQRGPSGEMLYAFEFEAGQHTSRALVSRAIFDGDYAVAGTERRAWADLLRREAHGLSERFAHAPAPSRPMPTGMAARPEAARATVSGAAS